MIHMKPNAKEPKAAFSVAFALAAASLTACSGAMPLLVGPAGQSNSNAPASREDHAKIFGYTGAS
jgi:hypothetical protein